MTFRDFNICCGALCAWREARGEGTDGQRAVLHVINNRSKYRGITWAHVIYEHLQFSSMTYGHDPQLCTVPAEDDKIFMACLVLSQSVYDSIDDDLTGGADHYFAPAQVMPTWAARMKFIKSLGHHDFYKEQ